uniref:Uncharacterized protein n=1 Tax=Schistosoma japonicum TaxID=6182 RepID=Q5C0S2_SCHJA|nr:unknown [Schistosoma japonicum]
MVVKIKRTKILDQKAIRIHLLNVKTAVGMNNEEIHSINMNIIFYNMVNINLISPEFF